MLPDRIPAAPGRYEPLDASQGSWASPWTIRELPGASAAPAAVLRPLERPERASRRLWRRDAGPEAGRILGAENPKNLKNHRKIQNFDFFHSFSPHQARPFPGLAGLENGVFARLSVSSLLNKMPRASR